MPSAVLDKRKRPGGSAGRCLKVYLSPALKNTKKTWEFGRGVQDTRRDSQEGEGIRRRQCIDAANQLVAVTEGFQAYSRRLGVPGKRLARLPGDNFRIGHSQRWLLTSSTLYQLIEENCDSMGREIWRCLNRGELWAQ